MKDTFGRKIEYMRISLTEKCNLRCRYCMPDTGVDIKKHDEMLTEEELLMICKVAARNGVKKFRLTGGEPLVKKNFLEICRNIKKIDGVEELCVTTNGSLLYKCASDLKAIGVDRINISLDTLDKEKFKFITRIGNLEDTLNGIKAAIDAGFKKIKINTVLIGGFNDDEVIDFVNLTKKYPIDVRFIELMPMYDSGDFKKEAFVPNKKVLDILDANNIKYKEIERLDPITGKPNDNGTAKLYKIEGALGNIGLISPLSHSFCATCNRVRLTADGKLKPCLHSNQEINIKGLSEEEMDVKFKEAILAKPAEHDFLSSESRTKAGRNMNQIGG
jgi:cyclic pyranopterin phosphate synthase